MSVSVIETLSGTILAAGSTVTVSTSLTANDMVVAVLAKTSTSGTPSISGLGSWVTVEGVSTVRDLNVWSLTGVTGGGNVTITPNSVNGDYVVLVLRSSASAAVTLFDSDLRTASSQLSITTADIVGPQTGMLAVIGATSSNSYTIPGADALPASGWTLAYTASTVNGQVYHQQLASASTVRAAAEAVANRSWTTFAAVFTDGDGAPPLTNTFTGWGVPIF